MLCDDASAVKIKNLPDPRVCYATKSSYFRDSDPINRMQCIPEQIWVITIVKPELKLG